MVPLLEPDPYILVLTGAGFLISLVAWLVHGQRLDLPAMLGRALIVAGAEPAVTPLPSPGR